MKKITFLFTLIIFAFSVQAIAQKAEKPVKNPLGVEQIIKNYEKHGLEISAAQKAKAEELALVQFEKMNQEKSEMEKAMSEEEQKVFFKSHKKTLRLAMNEQVLTEEQYNSLRDSFKASKN